MTYSKLLEAKGIDLKKRTSGNIKTRCPNCSENRKNKKDPCLSVNIDEGKYNCFNCDFKGHVVHKLTKEYVKPVPRLEKMGKKIIDWFENERKISNNTLLRFKITEATEFINQFEKNVPCICFNYYRAEELVNIKFRGPKKSFKMAKDAELIFYNLDAIAGEEECVIVEGEIDCLTLHECGIYNSVSVPNGASKGTQKLEYLDNCWPDFENKKKIILAVDGDIAGDSLKEELARRLGKNKCFIVQYPDGCKDANDVLVKYGREAVKELISKAIEWPLEGIVEAKEIYPTVEDYYEHGYPKGAVAHIPGFDELLTFGPGQLTMITGMPSSGKDEFTNWIMASLAKYEDWGWGIAGFEEDPPIHTSKLMEKIVGKAFDFRKDARHRMNQQEFDYAIKVVNEHFYFINMNEVSATMDSILDKAEGLVKKKGIRGLMINPWNCLEHKFEGSETQYVSEELTKLIGFLKRNNLHGFLVAHPTKLQKDPATKKYHIPTLYNISGSAHFYNKTHNGFSVDRDFSNNMVGIYVQKVKQSWMGKQGFCSFRFDTNTRQYRVLEDVEQESKPLNGYRPVLFDDEGKDESPF